MKIGFDAKRAFANNTGLGNYSRFIISTVARQIGLENVVAFTPKIKDQYKNFLPNVKVVLPTSLKSIWRSWTIKKDLLHNNIDIFHGLSHEIPFGLKKSGIKTVVTIHDLIFIRYPHLYGFLDRNIYRIKLNYALKNADKIIAISEFTKADILKYAPYLDSDSIEVVYQSWNKLFHEDLVTDIKTKFNLQKPYIVSVGTLEPRKNQLMLVKAFAALNKNNIELILVGRGKKYKDEILDFIDKNAIENVRILSNVENEDLPAVYSNSLFSAYISVIEGFGIPVVESLKCGTPVLAASGSCLEEAGGNGCIYVNPDNISEITATMQKMISNPTLLQKLTMEGQKHITKFDEDKIGDELIQIYQKLL